MRQHNAPLSPSVILSGAKDLRLIASSMHAEDASRHIVGGRHLWVRVKKGRVGPLSMTCGGRGRFGVRGSIAFKEKFLMELVLIILMLVVAFIGGSMLGVWIRRSLFRGVSRLRALERAGQPGNMMPARRLRPMPLVQHAVGVPVEHVPNPYPPYTGTLRINDPLRDNSAGYEWMNDREILTRETENCRFCDGSYRIVKPTWVRPGMVYCLAYETNFSDFVYQIEATLLQGKEIGMVFRQTPQYGFYYFYIRRDGSWGLEVMNRITNERKLLDAGWSLHVKIELNESNMLAVVANGHDLDLYLNHEYLTRVTDTTCFRGRISVGTRSDDGSPGEASFNNVMLWTLDEAGALN